MEGYYSKEKIGTTVRSYYKTGPTPYHLTVKIVILHCSEASTTMQTNICMAEGWNLLTIQPHSSNTSSAMKWTRRRNWWDKALYPCILRTLIISNHIHSTAINVNTSNHVSHGNGEQTNSHWYGLAITLPGSTLQDSDVSICLIIHSNTIVIRVAIFLLCASDKITFGCSSGGSRSLEFRWQKRFPRNAYSRNENHHY